MFSARVTNSKKRICFAQLTEQNYSKTQMDTPASFLARILATSARLMLLFGFEQAGTNA